MKGHSAVCRSTLRCSAFEELLTFCYQQTCQAPANRNAALDRLCASLMLLLHNTIKSPAYKGTSGYLGELAVDDGKVQPWFPRTFHLFIAHAYSSAVFSHFHLDMSQEHIFSPPLSCSVASPNNPMRHAFWKGVLVSRTYPMLSFATDRASMAHLYCSTHPFMAGQQCQHLVVIFRSLQYV